MFHSTLPAEQAQRSHRGTDSIVKQPDSPERAAYTVALAGDVIMNTSPSRCREPDVLTAMTLLEDADVTYAHLEIPLHDFTDPHAYPAAEGALSWMRGPTSVADELRRVGVDIVSLASNHALDYSYGGLFSTIGALDSAGIAHAGTGADLAAARAPAFVDTAVGRVALVSATSSFPPFARAGATRPDAGGRPGVNPLRWIHVVDAGRAEQLMGLAATLGLWVVKDGDEFVIHPPGLHNSVSRFHVDSAATEPTTECDQDDLAGIIDSISQARTTADLVLAQLHVQAWDGCSGRMSKSPEFAEEFAHVAVAAGADVVILQGSHAPMRGIEIHDGVPVLHDPGPLFRLGRREAQPHDFYARWGNRAAVNSYDATLLDAFDARDRGFGEASNAMTVVSPRHGTSHEPGFVLPVCSVDTAGTRDRVCKIELYPMGWSTTRRSSTGFPVRLGGARARAVLDRMAELSAPFGTTVSISDDASVGWVLP
jgi:poly-gamma-glutamate synthesis protein (capsule biosynthesis protein)